MSDFAFDYNVLQLKREPFVSKNDLLKLNNIWMEKYVTIYV